MFEIDLIEDFGKPSKKVKANQFVVRLENGTPVLLGVVDVVGEAGEAVSLLTYKDEKFLSELQRLGLEAQPIKVTNWKDRSNR